MKNLLASHVSLFVVALSASSARADDCGSSDRVPLPACAEKGIIQGTKPGVWVHNKCTYPITVKFDKPGSDVRTNIAAGQRIEQETPPYETTVTCCPRYSQCTTPPPPAPPPPSGLQNLALGKPATQSTTSNGGAAARAVDGNIDANWFANSVTHTDNTAQPWWQVDLGATKDISEVVLYNRSDCCAERLTNFEIKVSNDGVVWSKVAELAGTAPARSTYPVNASGRHVRVQLRGNNALSLAEVQVFGKNPPVTHNWVKMTTPANVTFKQVSVGGARQVWAVDTQGSPWRWTGATWEKIAGTVASLSVGADGVVWGLTPIDEVWMWRGGPLWERGVGTLRSVSAVNSDVVWGVQADGDTFRWDPAVKNWIKVATPANITFKQVSVGSAQHVWAVDTQGSPWRWTGSTWEKIAGTVASLSIGADGVVWGLTPIDEVWMWRGGPLWARGVGTLRSVSSVGGGFVWGVQSDGDTFRWVP